MKNIRFLYRIQKTNVFIFILICLCLFIIYNYKGNSLYNSVADVNLETFVVDIDSQSLTRHRNIIGEYYEKRKNLNTSNLGAYLFKNTIPRTDRDSKTFLVLIWKHWEWLKKRHVYYFGSTEHNPLDHCSVKNCKFTSDDALFNTADAVLVHIQRGEIPRVSDRNINQRWIFLNDESPLHSFTLAKHPPDIADIINVFNWSMTYRTDADIPVPYGRTIPLTEPKFSETSLDIATLVPSWDNKRRDVLVTILMSNCGVPHRMKYLKKLKEYIKIDIYGSCSDSNRTKSCPGHFRSDCTVIAEYLFYLVFENSLCHEYLTEKGFHQAYAKGAIPVIQGPPLEDCEKLLPPNSFLHVDSFATHEDLANEIIDISNDKEKLLSYHAWRNDFEVSNEHGYFGSKSYHFCRLCEALNYNDEKQSIYDESRLKLFFDPSLSCTYK